MAWILKTSELPPPPELRRRLQALATLDAIVCRDWEYRYYSFDSHWSKDEQLGSMRDGCGDSFLAVFRESTCFLKGFDHESEMSPYAKNPAKLWPGILDSVPGAFSSCLVEPAFAMDETTFCAWFDGQSKSWESGDVQYPATRDPDGSVALLALLDGRAPSYRAWAEEYYECDIDLTSVEHIYSHRELSPKIVEALNPDISLDDLKDDLETIGYPAKP